MITPSIFRKCHLKYSSSLHFCVIQNLLFGFIQQHSQRHCFVNCRHRYKFVALLIFFDILKNNKESTFSFGQNKILLTLQHNTLLVECNCCLSQWFTVLRWTRLSLRSTLQIRSSVLRLTSPVYLAIESAVRLQLLSTVPTLDSGH